MLILSRQAGERVVINAGTENECVLTVVEIRHGFNVRLGFEAPKNVTIHREEIWDAIKREGERQQADTSGQDGIATTDGCPESAERNSRAIETSGTDAR